MVEYIRAIDGGTVALKRRPTPGGVPVVFIHGLAVNADLWDLPDVHTPEYRYRSLAAMLQDAGCDVWLMNLRGHGAPHMHSTPPSDQRDWCVDNFVLHEMPAVAAHVMQSTGQRPFYIGASMGSMTLAGFLQGAVWDAASRSIVADPVLARARQSQTAGAVFAEFPARLLWPDSLFDARGRFRWNMLRMHWRRTDGDLNFTFEFISRVRWMEGLVDGMGGIPANRVKGNRGVEPWYRRLPGGLQSLASRAEISAVNLMLRAASVFTGATNHRAEVLLQGRRYVIDHMQAGVLRQMAKSVRARAFVSLLGAVDHVYSDHYGSIALPVLIVQGERDRIANHRVVREHFFDVIASEDKQIIVDPDIAHGEIEAAPVAYERLYPRMIEWVRARSLASHMQIGPAAPARREQSEPEAPARGERSEPEAPARGEPPLGIIPSSA